MVNGVYKPTYNWGAPPCRVGGFTTDFTTKRMVFIAPKKHPWTWSSWSCSQLKMLVFSLKMDENGHFTWTLSTKKVAFNGTVFRDRIASPWQVEVAFRDISGLGRSLHRWKTRKNINEIVNGMYIVVDTNVIVSIYIYIYDYYIYI